MKAKNMDCVVDYNQKSITRLETTVRIGIDHYKLLSGWSWTTGNTVRMGTLIRMEMSMEMRNVQKYN